VPPSPVQQSSQQAMRPPFIDILRCIKTLPVLCCGPSTKPLAPPDAERLAARFKALADPTRVAIVNRLAAGECCVCDLNAAFDLSQPTISHHLKLLRDAGLVESSRRGTWAYYRLVPDAVRALRQTLGA
jgi:ArsR family transcriptional regulator, arsenate/arsenite/antimonite-responsive transcriptional repressor